MLDHSQLWTNKISWFGFFPSKAKAASEKKNRSWMRNNFYLPNSVIWCPSLHSCFSMYWAWFRPWLLDTKSANNTIFILFGALELCKFQTWNEKDNLISKRLSSIHVQSINIQSLRAANTGNIASRKKLKYDLSRDKSVQNNFSAAKYKLDLV